jgi:hypothetical protein
MWKDSPEWGAVYSGLMTDCNEAVRPVHNRMPVLLHEADHELWLRGSLDDVLAFQGPLLPRRADRDGADGGSLDQPQSRGAGLTGGSPATRFTGILVPALFLLFPAGSAIMRRPCKHGRPHSCNHG